MSLNIRRSPRTAAPAERPDYSLDGKANKRLRLETARFPPVPSDAPLPHAASIVSLSDASSSAASTSPKGGFIDLSEDRSSESSSDDEPVVVDVRRSGRARKSNLIFVDGHAVLAQNNYVLKGGSYSYGAFDNDRKPPAVPSTKKRGIVGKKTARATKPRKVSAAESRRTGHNGQVKTRIARKAKERSAFLAKNVDTLAPFVESKVEASLRSLARKVGKTSTRGDDGSSEVFMQPDLVEATMRDYQLIGLNWMVKMHKKNIGMILGDEMGLGKTLQTISLFCYLKETEGITGPSLVICPLSVLYSWCNELSKWAPSLKFLRLHSSCLEEREAQKDNFIQNATNYDVVVTTYEMAKNPALTQLWRRQHFNYVVLDEGHIIKERTTQISQAVRHLHYENTLLLTGTPLQNNLVELWSLLNYLNPDVFTVSDPFAEAFDIGNNVVDKDKLELAHKVLDLFMLRRLKVEVERLMPPKIETKVICPLSLTQIHWYKGLLLKDLSLLSRASENSAVTTQKQLSNLIMQLRKCCNHPFLFEGAEVDIDSTTCEDLIAASGKLAVLDKLLRKLFVERHRVVLFSQFTSILDIIEDYCRERGWKYCRFDGSTPRARRNFIVNQFNAPGSDCFIFLMSTRSGGMGLNLQTADTCILYDSDWNPQPDIQAMARVHRIGQKKTVHVYRLVSGGTIEERIVLRAQKKLFLDQMVNRGSAVVEEDKVGGLSASELLSTLKFGCNAVFGEEDQNVLPTDEDIALITDRSRTEDSSAGKLKGGTTQTAKDFDASAELSESQRFGGVDFRALREKHKKTKVAGVPKSLCDISMDWAEIHRKEKRERKSRIVLVEGNGSGYGMSSVPVLASNNYDLESGESSVFNRELGGRSKRENFREVKQNRTFSGKDFGSQDFCMCCGDGGELLCCPSCPSCFHEDCVEATRAANGSLRCPHHQCCLCNKNLSSAGGILFPCQSCPNSFCEDCLPNQGVRLLGKCDRFEELGYDSTKHHAYIHCSAACERYAKKELGWSPKTPGRRSCPPAIDVSYAFGKKIGEEAIKTSSSGGCII